MKETYKTVLIRDLFHHLHGELVLIHRHVRRRVDHSHLVLGRSDLIVLCLGVDAKIPESLIQFGHERGDLVPERTEVMIVQFLLFRRSRTEQGASRVDQVPSLAVQFLVDEEVFLLDTNGRCHPGCLLIAESSKYAYRLSAQSLHRPQQGSFFIQSMTAVGAECGGDTQGIVLDKGV